MTKADNDNGASTPFNRATKTQSFARKAAEDLVRLRLSNNHPRLPDDLSTYPDVTLAACLRTNEIIDQYLDSPTVQKDALKAFLILSNAGTIPFNEKVLTKRYNNELSNMIASASPDIWTSDQAHLELATNVTLREGQLKNVLDPKVREQFLQDPVIPEFMAELEDYIAQMDQYPALYRHADRLVERHRVLTNELFQLINGSTPKSNNMLTLDR